MLVVLEICLAAMLLFYLHRIWSRPSLVTLRGLGIWLLMLVVCTALYVSLDITMPAWSDSLSGRIARLLALLTVAVVATTLFRRRYRKVDDNPVSTGEIRPVVDHSLKLGLTLLALLVTSQILTLSATMIHLTGRSLEGTWVLRHCVVLETTEPEPAEKTGPDVDINDLQDRLLGSLSSGFDSGKSFLAEVSGTRAVTRRLEIVRELTTLPGDEMTWLLDNHPPVRYLIYHPDLIALQEDREIARLAESAIIGSIPDLMTLLDDPRIRSLEEDTKLMKAVRSIDLMEIKRQLEDHRAGRN